MMFCATPTGPPKCDVQIPCAVPQCLNTCPGGFSDGGYARDANGCQTCECREEVSCATCPSGSYFDGCNQCNCGGGFAACTMMFCATPTGPPKCDVQIPCAVPQCLNTCPGGFSDGGYARDANGCQTCECRVKIPCAVPLCLTPCPGGFSDGGYASDANGCQTCECRIPVNNGGNSCGQCGDDCLEGGDMMGMCNSAGVCSFDYDNLGCSGQFIPILGYGACEDNSEGITRSFGDYGFTLQSCQQKCLDDSTCQAIDFYSSGWCNTYDWPCTNPQTFRDGSESWKLRGSVTFTLGSQGSNLCDNGGTPIRTANGCSEALGALSIPAYTLNNGQVCYKDGQGNGYADGYNGAGASYVCRVVS